ncbi:MAG: DnaB-like helicase C-terminal domain-containing protein, partial [Pseudomonadota bacterium]
LQIIGRDRDRLRSSRYEEISDACTDITRMGLELDVAVMLLSQLNREQGPKGGKSGGVENPDPGVPHIEGAKDSGSIEQDCQLGIVLHSPDYYWRRAARLKNEQAFLKKPTGRFVVAVQKQTGGKVGNLNVKFDGETQGFGPWDKHADDCTCWRCDIEKRRGGL